MDCRSSTRLLPGPSRQQGVWHSLSPGKLLVCHQRLHDLLRRRFRELQADGTAADGSVHELRHVLCGELADERYSRARGDAKAGYDHRCVWRPQSAREGVGLGFSFRWSADGFGGVLFVGFNPLDRVRNNLRLTTER